MADPFTTVTPPDLPALTQTDGSELVAVWRNGRLAKMSQRDLRGTKTFSGTTTPPYDPSRLFTLQASLNDRWRNTTTRDEHKLTSLDPVVWEFDGNVGGGKGDPGKDGAGISPKGQFATTADLPSMGLPGDLYVATANDTAQPPAFLAGDGAMYVTTGGTFGPGNRYRNIGPFRGPPGATTVDGLQDATSIGKALAKSTAQSASDVDVIVAVTDTYIGFTDLTASRTVILPDVDTYPLGVVLFIADERGKCSVDRSIKVSVGNGTGDNIAGQPFIEMTDAYQGLGLRRGAMNVWIVSR